MIPLSWEPSARNGSFESAYHRNGDGEIKSYGSYAERHLADPVPITLQTLAVVGLGLFLGPVRGSGIVVVYMLYGLAGFPVFAGTPGPSGLAYVAGPTGGYLAGFAISAFAAGWLARKGYGKTIPGAVTVAVVASALIYVPGLAWLGVFTGYGERLLTAGLYPFVLGDLVKSAIAGLIFIAASTVVPGLGHISGEKSEKK